MTVTARWDGDVWVEVDDALVLETRRWIEGDFLVVARTTTRADGRLVTSRAFMGRPPAGADVRRGASRGDRSRRRETREEEGEKGEDGARGGASRGRGRQVGRRERGGGRLLYEKVGDGGVRVRSRHALRRLRGQGDGIENPKVRGRDVGVVRARGGQTRGRGCVFRAAPFDSVLRILPVHPQRRARPPVHLRVLRRIRRAQPLPRRWWSQPPPSSSTTSRLAPAPLFSSVSPRDSTSSWTSVGDGDAAYECMVNMLEERSKSRRGGVQQRARRAHRRATPRRVRTGALRLRPRRASRVSPGGCRRFVAIATAALGRYGRAVAVRDPPSRARPPGSDARSRSRRPRRTSRRTAWWWRWRAAGSGRMATARHRSAKRNFRWRCYREIEPGRRR